MENFPQVIIDCLEIISSTHQYIKEGKLNLQSTSKKTFHVAFSSPQNNLALRIGMKYIRSNTEKTEMGKRAGMQACWQSGIGEKERDIIH